ncbi:endonuclease/exonuclease/phosphatase family protein [Cypionkella sp.]|uniref:endonuclease/exonuclease/phosphatase family protein n=1 Tax=Cypionkella sp. TaxID=2811411 RepID=UPI002722F776|nr:endonuclease/exonuclease/phosphatase family protein [Cypionkella sp.]MDO8985265.1 endonuclease/exonuclease/phosphatase family protein [Cypionkella sp.]MDP2051751.1 endonuclease/exonuclease/phosphatase family protein [Cypionkella sp.]
MRPDLRVAIYNIDFWAKGPGLALQSLTRGDNPAQLAAIQVIAKLDANVLLLTGIDYDLHGDTLAALEKRLTEAGASYPYRLPLRPNTGVATGLDLDGNGILGEPRDAMAYGRWAGEGGMAILSRLPIDTENIRDFSGFLWADLPGALMPPDTPPGQLLSTTGAYEVPITLPDGKILRLLAYYAGPPIFDGPEDRNGRRNHDESAFWLHLLAGDLHFKPPEPPFVILGQSNLDPADGAGRKQAITALLHHFALQDPRPRGQSTRHDPGQSGDPALDTALYPVIGGLRVEIVLPSKDLHITASGVEWPPDSDPTAAILTTASRHHPLWVDLAP